MVRKRTRLALVAAAGLSGLLAWFGEARAAGFALREGSPDWMANAFAGESAKAYDASTAWANPAGMVRLNWNEVDTALNILVPSSHFSGNNFVGPLPTPGNQGGNLAQTAVTPGLFGVWNFSPDLKFGIATLAPFGQLITNPSNFVGRYQSIVSHASDIAVSLSAAYRINQHFSIGGGPIVDYFSARLTQAVNTGPSSLITGDPTADVHGNDVSVGFNVGALYQLNDALRIGLTYRSRIQHGITGTQSIFVPPLLEFGSPGTAAFLRRVTNSDVRTKVQLPEEVNLGVYYQINPQWAVMTEVQWTNWAVIKSVNITPTTPGVIPTVIRQDFRNTWFGAVGASYRPIDPLLLQIGFAFDESPVTNSNRTTRIPDSNRYFLSTGVQYKLLSNLTLQAAYGHVFFQSAPILNSENPLLNSGVIVGKYNNQANTFSVGATYRF